MKSTIYLKRVGIVSLFVLAAIASQAQSKQYLGVRGAYSMSSVSFDPYKETTSVSGADFGVSYKLYAEKYMGTQLELNYVQKGYATVDTTFNATAIELPAMAQGFVLFGPVRVFLNAGIYASYLLDQTATIKDVSGNEREEPYTFKDRDNRFEYGILGGGGAALQISKFELQVEARYQYGLGYLMQPRYDGQPTVFANSSHTVFSLALYYNL